MAATMKRLAALLLAAAMAFAIVSVLGTQVAYAGGGTNINGVLEGATPGQPISVGTTLTVKMSSLNEVYGDFEAQCNAGKAHAEWRVGDKDIPATFTGGKTTYQVQTTDFGKEIVFFTLGDDSAYSNNTAACKVDANYLTKTKINATTGSFTLTGHSLSSEFSKLLVYDGTGKAVDVVTSGVNSKMDFSFTFDSTQYDPGLYNMVAVLKDDTQFDLTIQEVGTGNFYKTFFSSNITKKPEIKKNSDYFSTGYNYVCFQPYFTIPKDSAGNAVYGKVWLQLYDVKAKKWGDTFGPFDSYERLRTDYFTGNKASGGVKIKADRTYKARVRYGKEVTYNGSKQYLWGPYSNTVTIKTGKSKAPSIKSITAKATSVAKTTLITKAHWDVYGKWHPYKKETIWTTTYKVTVKLKKKPGTTGIISGDKKVKGNKLVYTTTFKDSGKLKGKKIKIGVSSYNDAKVGGYGKVVKKKVKVK